MTFGEELMQLLLIIGALLMALAGINFWTKKGGSITLPPMGGKSADPASGVPANTGDETNALMDDVGSDANPSGEGNSGGGSGGSVADRHGDRFDLTGKDAEAAARVLKRMLKQDSKFKDQSENQ